MARMAVPGLLPQVAKKTATATTGTTTSIA